MVQVLKKDFLYTTYPLSSSKIITHFQYQKTPRNVTGNFNPYTGKLEIPKVTKSLATSKKSFKSCL